MDREMNTQKFRDAVLSARQRPKGVKVSSDLFRQLQSEGAISTKSFTLWGLPTDAFKFDLPAFDNDIYVHEDPTLDGDEFRLPSSSL